MRHAALLAWRYLAAHRGATAVLVCALGLILALPLALAALARQAERSLTARAASTPLLVGARGSPLELTLASLYFRSRPPATLPFAAVGRVQASGLARAVPLDTRFRAQGDPVVGTSVDYFAFRGLRVADGTPWRRLGDCVIGARVARTRGLGPGGTVVTTPESTFDVAGVYPLRMRVVGTLAPSGTPDDDAIFVDTKTAWVIEGRGHGHQDLTATSAETIAGVTRAADGGVRARDGAVAPFQEVTDANADSFHFHGDTGTFPITAVLAIPGDERDRARLLGRYQGDGPAQAVEPRTVLAELLGTVLTLERYALAVSAVVGAATLALAALVRALALRLRAAEFETLARVGGSRGRVRLTLLFENLAVLGMALLVAASLAGGVWLAGPSLVRLWAGG